MGSLETAMKHVRTVSAPNRTERSNLEVSCAICWGTKSAVSRISGAAANNPWKLRSGT